MKKSGKGVGTVEAGKWKLKINKQIKNIGLEPKEYASIVQTLSDILEQRDAVYAQYQEEGAVPIIEYTNKGGATNTAKNPLLILWNDLNSQALTHWRELCLTPAAYKKMTGAQPAKDKKTSALVEALKNL